ncbi:MAG: 16S rRNA (adenine(1518)-N(6)/adenine(1519)-N(6))-dimethyltransferase RsmA [Oscillospiraceae bacterium]|nr:16S rRNA (adenine(1518)-N(6)/adenine(1519)-N(6))-dimethyltransferase RsmA [Oscillospiraceae bacterium]
MDLTNYKEVTAQLERHGFRFSKSLGQNFLTAAWVPRRIAKEALIAPGDGVLEVGPGVGCLTVELAEKAERVLALELDERLRGVLSETLSEHPNVSVVFADAVKADLRSLCGEYFGGRPVRVCAHLPYNVTSPLLTAFLKAGCFESVTVMVQKEVAARLCARPGTAEYGAFTLLVQWYAEAEKLFDVPPDCFMPRPKVTSTVIRLCRRPSPPVRVRDEEFFFAVVRAAFNQRRKTLVNAVSAGMRNVERADVEKALAEMGLSPTVRGEALSAEQFAALSDILYTPNAG